MAYLSRVVPQDRTPFSPLMLSDRLLTLAQDADRAGYREAAEHLLSLAEEVLDRPQPLCH
jgi:hypothetical protein